MTQGELRKHERYKTIVGGLRVTQAKLIPISLSSLGGVGKEARGFFAMLGIHSVEEEEDDFALRGARRLVSLCSFLSAMYSAENAMAAYISPECGPAGRVRRAAGGDLSSRTGASIFNHVRFGGSEGGGDDRSADAGGGGGGRSCSSRAGLEPDGYVGATEASAAESGGSGGVGRSRASCGPSSEVPRLL